MELDAPQYALLFFAALVSAGVLTPLMRTLAFRLDIVDRPTQEHKTHRDPIPYLGGVAIIIAVFLVVIVGSALVDLSSQVTQTLLVILTPCLFMGVVGLIDDIKNLTPFSRFLAQTISGFLAAFAITTTDNVGSPTGYHELDLLISVFWIVGITNAINFFDNHDGGASGTVAISSLTLGSLCLLSNQYYIGALAFVLAGASGGFLIWNRNPARIYMGDAGALFLGMLISTLLLRFDPSPINRWAGFAIPILILALPIMDTSVAVISRIARGLSPFVGGQDHLSHRLVRRGNSRRSTAFILWGGSAFFAALAISISLSPYDVEGLLTGVAALFWLVVLVWFYRQEHSPRDSENVS